ncbi:MAG TPA: GMC oxidoreductase, partial [Bryobacteraceae bacterium]|nr:GMC oxidoreductase [Bryobacteraceae bacterium]
GKVKAISYVDKATRTEQQIRCRTVVLAASSCESARLLLNSKSSRHPAGLANSSGVVGHYLTDTVASPGMSAFIPALVGMPHYNSDGYGVHAYIPWWLYDKKDKEFPRGYHIEFGGGFGMPAVGALQGVCRRHEGYGASLQKAIHEEYGATMGFSGRGEMIPNKNCYLEIDPDVVDQWGIPVPRFHWQWSEYELMQADHMQKTFRELIEAMGGTVIGDRRGNGEARRISRGGAVIHELGTVRMGNDPKTSPLNKYCQAHDVKNLFVADAGPFVSNSDKNPTLTIIALAWRTAEYLAEEMRKGNV